MISLVTALDRIVRMYAGVRQGLPSSHGVVRFHGRSSKSNRGEGVPAVCFRSLAADERQPSRRGVQGMGGGTGGTTSEGVE